MTNLNEAENQAPVELIVAPRYDEIDHWLVLTSNGDASRILKSEPRSLAASEISVRIKVRVPKRVRRIAQTIVITMPDERTHVAEIDVAVPSVSEEDRS